ncbi:inositol monophosphatase family protein [Corynebacterium sp. 13CS0277]|uniref:inositol monophosphatase family protein n=1 Tax=Corynebacterium sp. 13CS0277 TaxID=2071994 RepID=UPI001304FA31|nr:inositol monophosphatase family protein [Corynebacterium sp. 13CS0277]
MTFTDVSQSTPSAAAHHRPPEVALAAASGIHTLAYPGVTPVVTTCGEQATPALLGELRQVARALCARAFVLVQELLATGPDTRAVAHTKSEAWDPVTRADLAVEAMVSEYLATHRPGDGLIGEEGTRRPADEDGSGITWVVDPVDGTVNFVYGIPMSAVSIGVMVGEELCVGAVVNLTTGELFHAARGQGAAVETPQSSAARPGEDSCSTAEGTTRGELHWGAPRALHVNAPETLPVSLLATGFSYDPARRARQGAMLASLLGTVRDIRRAGSAALDLCQLAQGRVDLYWEHALNVWDFAAGAVIAAEAGAVVCVPTADLRADDGAPIFAAAPSVAADCARALAEVGGWDTLPAAAATA